MLNMNSIEQDLQAKPKSFKLKLVLAKLDYIDNIKYQRNSFIKSMEILDQYGIDYDIILYPNLIHTREDKQLVMKEYYTKIFPEIDYNKHSLIVMQDSTFTNANLWFDMNHLSYDGASRFSQFIFEELR